MVITPTRDVTAAIDLKRTPFLNSAKPNKVANSAINFKVPPETFPLRKIIEHPIRQVYTAHKGP